MGDPWLRDFERAKKTATQLAREVEGHDFAERKLDARQAAVLRVNMAQLRQEVSRLEQSLMAISQNTQAHGVTRKELSRRGDLIAGLSEQVEDIQQSILSSSHRRTGHASETPWRDGEGRSRDATSIGRSTEKVPVADLVAMADQEVSNQDETLDFLSGTVHNLKNMGGDISQEIGLHCELLSSAEEQSESLLGKTRQQHDRLNSFREDPVTCYLWVCISVLLVTLFVLLVFF